jgi:hypothetical protein
MEKKMNKHIFNEEKKKIKGNLFVGQLKQNN